MTYMIQVAVSMTVLYLVFKWLMADTTFYSVNRALLMAIYAVSWLLPLFTDWLSGLTSVSGPVSSRGIVNIEGLQSVILDSPAEPPYMPWLRALIWLYICGTLIAAVITGVGALRLWKIVRSGRSRQSGNITVIVTELAPGPFSWGKYIVLRPCDMNENHDLIVAHEREHIHRWHWIDLVAAQLTLIFQWFSPAAWLMMRSLKVTHEYEVDASVAGDDPVRYQMMLIKMTVGARLPVLADSLNHSQLKKRLTMMMTKKSAPSRRYATLALPAAAMAALAILSQPSVARVSRMLSATEAWPAVSWSDNSVRKDNKSLATAQNPDPVYSLPSVMASGNDGNDAGAMTSDGENTAEAAEVLPSDVSSSPAGEVKEDKETPAVFVDGVLIPYGDLQKINSGAIKSMVVVKNDPAYPQGKIMVSTKESGVPANAGATETTIDLMPEKLAEYRGGMPGLMEDLKNSLVYPDELKKDIRVTVQFTIGTDGSVSNARVVKGAGADCEACDQIALNAVMRTSGNWEPAYNGGKPVASQFTLPVLFKYPSKATESSK